MIESFVSFLKALVDLERLWFGLAVAFGIVVFGPNFGIDILKGDSEKYIPAVQFGFVIFSSLAAIAILRPVGSIILFPINMVKDIIMRRKVRQHVYKELSYLNSDEIDIISYYVTRREKNFFAGLDGGRAAGLLGRGIIELNVRGSQQIDMLSAPFTIRDAYWEVLQENAEQYRHPRPEGRSPLHRGII